MHSAVLVEISMFNLFTMFSYVLNYSCLLYQLFFFRHPIALFFQMFFRTLALILYVFASYIFSTSFVQLFISIILLLALDFWVVKNVTGRLLVGLRWWNKVEEDGTSIWIFESKNVRDILLIYLILVYVYRSHQLVWKVSYSGDLYLLFLFYGLFSFSLL